MKFNETIFAQYQKQGSKCLYCDEPTPYELITRDHFYPLSSGKTLVNNKVYCCKSCNARKGSKTLEEFKDSMLDNIRTELNKMVNNGFKMSEKGYKNFLYFHRSYMKLTYLVNNKETIELFT